MKQEERLLFLYAAPNGGHKECADALRKAFKNHPASPARTDGLDAVTSLYPILGPVIARAYLEIVRHTPQIWNFLYDNRDIESVTRELRQFFSFLDGSRLKFLLAQYRPSAFVCTHAIACGLIAQQKARGNCDLPLVGVITDYAVHSYWIHPEVDLYLAANPETRETLVQRGVPPEKIAVCGIPIDPAFGQSVPRAEAKRKLGFDPVRPLVLIMGGAHGLGPIATTAQEILSMRQGPQLAVAAGLNKEVQLELFKFNRTKGLQVYGYTKLVPLLMDAADLLVTKPGGITTSEALAKGLPMVLVNPIPGQEERNARYLLRQGAALRVKEVGELKETIRFLLSRQERLKLLTEKALRIARPQAARDCCARILELLRERTGALAPSLS